MTEPITVASERRLLSTHLTWCAQQPWIDSMYAELTGLLAQLRSTNGTAEPRPIARCHLPADDSTCGGGIRINDVDGCAYCERCRETWTADAVRDLAQVIAEQARPRTDDGRAMMTVAQIVERFGGNANSVRLKLSRAGLASVDGYYDPAIFQKVTA